MVFALLLLSLPVAGAFAAQPGISLNGTDLDVSTIPQNIDNRYGYLHVQSVEYTMNNMNAEIRITYTIEPWIAFLVYLFGKQDLKKRVIGVMQYPEPGYEAIQDLTFTYIDSNHAILSLKNAALDNQDNSYWIRPHSFGCTIPLLTFAISKNDIKTYMNVKDMEKGIGFFRS